MAVNGFLDMSLGANKQVTYIMDPLKAIPTPIYSQLLLIAFVKCVWDLSNPIWAWFKEGEIARF